MAKTHKDVQYHVTSKRGGEDEVFSDFDEASARAVTLAVFGGDVLLDVVVFSRAGAKAVFGESGIEQYNEDPEASVFERLVIKVNSLGRVP